jgi:hypothetical protein
MYVTSSFFFLWFIYVYEYFQFTYTAGSLRTCGVLQQNNVFYIIRQIVIGATIYQVSTKTMSSSPILHTYPFQVNGNTSFVDFRTAKILIAAKYAGKEIKVEESCVTEDGKLSQELLKKCPLGKIPSLQLGSASKTKIIGESNAAAYYLSNDELKGGEDNDVERAQVLQWMNFAEVDLIPMTYNWVFPILGLMKTDEKEKAVLEKLLDLLTKLDNHLGLFGGCFSMVV